MRNSDIESMYADLKSCMDIGTTGLVETAENYRLVAVGALTLLDQIIKTGIQDEN